MRNYLEPFARYGGFFIFLFLEIVCFILIIRFNQKQQNIFLHSANLFSGYLYEGFDKTLNYLHLQTMADSLIIENAHLIEQKLNQISDSSQITTLVRDSMSYNIIGCRIINNSVNRNNNYFTLNAGERDGIKPHMGAFTTKGIAGIVLNVSDKYSRVLSVLHRQSRVSASVRRSGYFGTLVWIGNDTRFLQLIDVPKHADVQVGDTIVTSGYSEIFPPDLLVGIVDKVDEEPGSNFHYIKVKLTEDLANIHHVYIVKNNNKIELEVLEESVDYE